MEKVIFEFYTRPNGHTEFLKYLESLNKKERARLLAIIKMISIQGISTGIQHNWVKRIDKNLYEVRSRVSNNQQRGLYFHEEVLTISSLMDLQKRLKKRPNAKSTTPKTYVQNI